MSTLYGARGADQSLSKLFTVDPVTGAATFLSGAAASSYSGLAFDFTDGTLYAVTGVNSTVGDVELAILDPVTGAVVTFVGVLGITEGFELSDIVCDEAGVLYGLPNDGVTGVGTIDKATGVFTSLGGDYVTPPGAVAGGLAFDGTDLLAFQGTGGAGAIYRIDRATGNGTLLASLTGYAPSGTNPEVNAATVGPDGLTIATINKFDTSNPHVDLVSIADDGTVALIGATTRSFDALAWDSPPPSPAPPAPITQRGVCIAFDDAMLEPDPTWTSLYDSHDAGLRVQEWTIDRGRATELDKSKTGTATITIRDFAGILDPTNSTGPFYGKIEPLKQLAIFLTDPTTDAEKLLFRGLIEDIDSELDISETFITHTITAVDLLDVLANAEVIPGAAGEADYVATDVQTRILGALDDAVAPATWPPELGGPTTIFSGNVRVQARKYAPRDSILSVVQEAADAEFPGVANFYAAKDGPLMFKGRDARFNPADAHFNIGQWYAGDGAAVDADTMARVVPISGLRWRRSKGDIYNSVLATPMGIADADIPGQLSVDAPSVAARGVRSNSFENLQTGDGNPDGNDRLAETKLFADYYVDNYAEPRTRISTLTFTTRRLAAKNLHAWWRLVIGIDISDVITVTTSHPGGGGFDEDYFTEGLRYRAIPLRDEFPQITLDVDLSPRAYYTTNPFPSPP